MSDDFWAVITRQLNELRSAATVDDVLKILADPPPSDRLTYGLGISGHAFFAGSGGEGTVCEALTQAGWHVAWMRADYYWIMRTPDNQDAITYIEGDIYRGDRR